jgi:hypothetical protein
MLATITQCEQVAAQMVCTYQTPFGEFTAPWHGEEPQIGVDYYIEIEVTDLFMWDENVIISESVTPSIQQDDDTIIITGVLELLDADGFAALRLGSALVTFEVAHVSNVDLGTPLRLFAKDVSVFDTNV